MTLKYKVTVVRESEVRPKGAKHPVKTESEVCLCGYFSSEEALARWALENQGKLPKSESQE